MDPATAPVTAVAVALLPGHASAPPAWSTSTDANGVVNLPLDQRGAETLIQVQLSRNLTATARWQDLEIEVTANAAVLTTPFAKRVAVRVVRLAADQNATIWCGPAADVERTPHRHGAWRLATADALFTTEAGHCEVVVHEGFDFAMRCTLRDGAASPAEVRSPLPSEVVFEAQSLHGPGRLAVKIVDSAGAPVAVTAIGTLTSGANSVQFRLEAGELGSEPGPTLVGDLASMNVTVLDSTGELWRTSATASTPIDTGRELSLVKGAGQAGRTTKAPAWDVAHVYLVRPDGHIRGLENAEHSSDFRRFWIAERNTIVFGGDIDQLDRVWLLARDGHMAVVEGASVMESQPLRPVTVDLTDLRAVPGDTLHFLVQLPSQSVDYWIPVDSEPVPRDATFTRFAAPGSRGRIELRPVGEAPRRVLAEW